MRLPEIDVASDSDENSTVSSDYFIEFQDNILESFDPYVSRYSAQKPSVCVRVSKAGYRGRLMRRMLATSMMVSER